jgi:penicillin G amidase
VAALAAAYWYAYRPLPQSSGTVPAPVEAPVAIARDRLGTPHITGRNLEDTLFAQGYATAQDRLWQMDTLRRLAGGELAELFGAPLIESDTEARRLGLPRLATAAVVTMPAADRAALAAYARGVNAYIEQTRGSLPVEFTLLGYQPRPWRLADSVLCAYQMFRMLTGTWRTDLLKQGLAEGGNRAKVDFLFPTQEGDPVTPGSNAWAVSGRWTASGRPLLANDMHLEFSLPGIWHAVHIRAPGLDAAGVTVPGLPGVVSGHNARIAWGLTNLGFDVQDLYRESIDDRTGSYLFRGAQETARREFHSILVKGGKPAERVVWVTRHGPLWAAEGKSRMALRWAAAEPGMFAYPFLELDRASNWSEFNTALARFPGPAQNFVYADVDGNIGYHAAGRLPARRGFSGDVPLDGASGKFEWEGFIPFEQLPSVFNPPGGMIVSANQNPFPAAYPYSVGGDFAPPDRALQIRRRISARKGWQAEQMLGVQCDVYSDFDKLLARRIVEAWDRRRRSGGDSAQGAAAELLRNWNGQMDRNAPAPLITTLAFRHFRKAAAESASPGKGGRYEYEASVSALRNLLERRPPGWFADFDGTLLKSFGDAVEEGQRIQGRDPRKWIYGKTLELTLGNPVVLDVAHRVPMIWRYFQIGPVMMSGSPTAVKQTTRTLGPSMRMVADLAAWDRSLLNLPAGESGHPLSRHYTDQWEAYFAGRSFAMQFEKVEASGTLTLEPR